MAHYKYPAYMVKNEDDAFDALHEPGDPAPFAGIYRCMNCGKEVGIANDHTLPPPSHFTHEQAKGPIKWRLIVWADHNPK